MKRSFPLLAALILVGCSTDTRSPMERAADMPMHDTVAPEVVNNQGVGSHALTFSRQDQVKSFLTSALQAELETKLELAPGTLGAGQGAEPLIAVTQSSGFDPWQQLQDLDVVFRDPLAVASLAHPELFPINQFSVISVDQSVFKTIPNAGILAAATYVQVGRDFERTNDLGGASQADWAALRLAGNSVTSKENREAVREVAYGDLANLAAKQRQPRWAAMLRLCADLSNSYLKSGQAAAELRSIEQLKQNVENAQARVDAAKARSDQAISTQHGAAAVQGGIVVAKAIFAGVINQSPTAALESIDPGTVVEVGSELVTAQQESQAANDAYAKAMQKIEQASIDVSAKESALMQPDQDQAIEEGKSFLAEETSYYLIRADDPTPYFRALDQFASDKPDIQHALASYKVAETNSEKDAAVLELVTQLRAYELFVARNERRGIVPSPSQMAALGSSADSPANIGSVKEGGAAEKNENRNATQPLEQTGPAVPPSTGPIAEADSSAQTEASNDCYKHYSNAAYDEAVAACRKAADQGNAVAASRLGLMYQNGWGVSKDPKEAMRWYGKADELEQRQ